MLLEKMYGPELVQAFREFKAIWDPLGMMNPGKVVDPFPITSNFEWARSFVHLRSAAILPTLRMAVLPGR